MFQLKKISPVMLVDAIEPVLDFWKRLGFTAVAEVPHGDALGFVILSKDDLEVMYQTRAATKDDVAAFADYPSSTMLFVEVSDLDAVIKLLGDAPIVVPRRKTFYGTDEIGVRDPVGNAILFARPEAG